MKRSIWISFLMIEILIYLSFLALDLMSALDTKWIKFASILLVALMSPLLEQKLLTAALITTAFADIFLLLLDRWYFLGVLMFGIVQLFYSVYLKSGKVFILQGLLVLISVIISIGTGSINAIAVGYIAIFFINLMQAFARARQKKTSSSMLFLLGLTLFFCCDLCVGYYNTGSGPMWSFARIAMWGFYLPGQVLILLSGKASLGEVK